MYLHPENCKAYKLYIILYYVLSNLTGICFPGVFMVFSTNLNQCLGCEWMALITDKCKVNSFAYQMHLDVVLWNNLYLLLIACTWRAYSLRGHIPCRLIVFFSLKVNLKKFLRMSEEEMINFSVTVYSTSHRCC